MQTDNGKALTEKRIFTTGEAADLCKVSQQTIIRCFDAGRLGGFRVPGSKFRRIPRADLIRFMKDNDIPTDALEGGRKRVLVVDDDPAMLEVFREIFRAEPGIEVRTCGTGYDAGMLTEAFRPHVILLDYLLPDVNGDLVCRRLRERDETRDIKVVFVSGAVSPTEVKGLLDAGAQEFIQKPFSVPQVLSTVKRLLEV